MPDRELIVLKYRLFYFERWRKREMERGQRSS